MFKFAVILLIIIITFNAYSFTTNTPIFIRIIGHGLFMPAVGLFYGAKRNWQFTQLDRLIYLSCLIGCLCDTIIFFDFDKKGEFLQMVANFFVNLILIVVFRREGAFVFNIAKTNILKVLIPAFICFFFFGFVLMNILPNVMFFVGIIYTVEVTIFVILAFYRPTSTTNYWLVSLGVTVLMLRDVLYSYFFYIYHGSYLLLYIPLYLSNAIGYFLIIYGVALNQNEKNKENKKISWEAFLEAFASIFKAKEIKHTKSRIYDAQIV